MPQAEPLLPPQLFQPDGTIPVGKAESTVQEFGIEHCEPDWTDGRYRVYTAWGEADCMRYGQGKRYDFCISRRHHNYYHDYRARYNSSYHFVYDDACSPQNKTHVIVVAACADGSHGVVYANNAADYDTRRIGGSLDRFLATKPGLELAKDLFTCHPLTPAEMADIAAARAVGAGTEPFQALTPAQQLMFVRLGSPLTDDEYVQATMEVREAYISRAHLLTNAQARYSTEPQRRRAAQLFRLYNVAERLLTAEWLQDYPLPAPAIVAAHYTSAWPPSAADMGQWRVATPAASAPALSAGNQALEHSIAGLEETLNLSRLQQAMASNPAALFPVDELTENPIGEASGPVIIARYRDGFIVLTGNALLHEAKMAGDVDIAVRLATRANLIHARTGTT